MNINLTLNEVKAPVRRVRRRRIYNRRVTTAANAKCLLCALAQSGFLSTQQVEVLIALLGVSNV